jgi:ankyrin repeat protein
MLIKKLCFLGTCVFLCIGCDSDGLDTEFRQNVNYIDKIHSDEIVDKYASALSKIDYIGQFDAQMLGTFFSLDDVTTLEVLLDDGLDPNFFCKSIPRIDSNYGKTCYSQTDIPLLHIAIAVGAEKCMRLLLDRGANLNLISSKGGTFLDALAYMSSTNVVRWANEMLLNSMIDIDYDKNTIGWTALYRAIKLKNTEFISFLVDRGASCNRYYYARRNRLSNEFYKCWYLFDIVNLNFELFRKIIKQANLNVSVKDEQGRGVLFYLDPRIDFYKERLRLLIEKGCVITEGGNEPNVITAIFNKRYPFNEEEKLYELLEIIKECGMPLDWFKSTYDSICRSKSQIGGLQNYSAKVGSLKRIIASFSTVEKNAGILNTGSINTNNKDQQKISGSAIEKNVSNVASNASYFKKIKAIEKSIPPFQDSRSEWLGSLWLGGAIHSFFKDDDVIKLKYYIDKTKKINDICTISGSFKPVQPFLQKNSAGFGFPLFYLATLMNATNCMEVLMENGCDLKLRTTTGHTMLFACSKLNEDVAVKWAERIISATYIPIDDDNNIRHVTALHNAIIHNNFKLCEYLLSKKANPNRFYYNKAENEFRHWYLFDVVNARIDILKLFLNLENLDVNVQDLDGNGVDKYLRRDHADYSYRVELLKKKGVIFHD